MADHKHRRGDSGRHTLLKAGVEVGGVLAAFFWLFPLVRMTIRWFVSQGHVLPLEPIETVCLYLAAALLGTTLALHKIREALSP